jgi:hypothetical protein
VRTPTCDRRLRRARLLPALLPVAAIAALPGCVIPLAPDFQDPSSEPNLPPHIVSSMPDQGSLVAGNVNLRFQVGVSDPNPGDALQVRWFADFPPYQGSTRPLGADIGSVPPSADGSVQTTLLDAVVDCFADNLVPGVDQHTVTVVISDAPKLVPAGPTTPFDGTHEVTATWSVLLQCPTFAP